MARNSVGQQSTNLKKNGSGGVQCGISREVREVSLETKELKQRQLGESGDGQIRMGEL